MRRICIYCLLAIPFVVGPAIVTTAQEAKTKDKKVENDGEKNAVKEDKKSKEASDGEKEKQKELSFKGSFEAVKMAEVKVTPKEWSTYKIESVVEHGEEVQAGDTLIAFETEDYEKAVEAAEVDLKTSELTLESARLEFEIARQSLPAKIKSAEMADRVATEDLKEWLTGGKQRRIKSTDRSVKAAKNRLAYQLEELKQLERMYKADDLTEETEEIILKRTRDTVDSVKYSLELSENSARLSKEFAIPRSEEALKNAVKQSATALKQSRENLPRQLRLQEIKLQQQELAHEEKQKKLKRLRGDRKTLNVTTPRSGHVYYGSSKRGVFSDSSTIGATLKEGGTAKADSVLMTVVQTAPLKLRIFIGEDSIRHVKVGTKCEIKSVAYPDEKINGSIESLSTIPVSDGKFDATVKVKLKDLKGRVLPGMKATVLVKVEE